MSGIQPPHSLQSSQTSTADHRILRILLGGVALAAGITGVALLASPADTGDFFSWELEPAPLAALIGGSYLASLLVFGVALRASWVEVRGLVIGTLALTIPMLVSTFTHLGVFDFDRWQAWGWVGLFIASPLAFGTVILRLRGEAEGSGGWPAPWAMVVAGVLAVIFVAVAVLLWIDPSRVAGILFPFDLPPFGGRVLGCWVAFLAFLAGWIATHTREESWIPALGLTAFSAGALGGAILTLDGIQPAEVYLAVLAILTIVSWVVLTESRRKTRH